jgi:hypothetical protein
MTVWRFANALRYPGSGWTERAIGQFTSFGESFLISLLSSEMFLLACITTLECNVKI